MARRGPRAWPGQHPSPAWLSQIHGPGSGAQLRVRIAAAQGPYPSQVSESLAAARSKTSESLAAAAWAEEARLLSPRRRQTLLSAPAARLPSESQHSSLPRQFHPLGPGRYKHWRLAGLTRRGPGRRDSQASLTVAWATAAGPGQASESLNSHGRAAAAGLPGRVTRHALPGAGRGH